MSKFVERVVDIGGVALAVREAGDGPPLLVLHDELGPTEWVTWHGALAGKRRLVMPIHPGFRGERVKWMRGVRDLACFYIRFLDEYLPDAVDVLGFSFGGWIAAEMAVGNPALFKRMALVAPFGVKPEEGHIMDFFPMSSADYLKNSFANPETAVDFAALYGDRSPKQYEDWEDARTECARLAWEPYMFNPSLPHLLPALTNTDALILYGDRDGVLPESAVRTYAANLPKARVATISGAGHRPEAEKPEAFARELIRFLD